MKILLPLLILAAQPEASTDLRHPDAVQVYHCDFEDASDANFDKWPDGWTRRRGKDYPVYLEVGISQEPSPVGDRCLRINLDGGAATLHSPPVVHH